MRKIVPVLVMFFLTLSAFSAEAAPAPKKPKATVAVLDFKESPQTQGFGIEASEALSGEMWGGIFGVGPWAVVRRKELIARLSENGKYLGLAQYKGREELVSAGRRIGVKYLIYGGLGEFGVEQELRKTKKTVEVGTGQYKTERERKYLLAGPKVDKQVEIKKSADVDTVVVHSRAALRIMIGVLDTETGQSVWERVLEPTGEFDDAEPPAMIRSLIRSGCKDFVTELKKNSGPQGQIVA